ncbi:MAG: tRNA uridine-5-carboxymethylaminomethyl(34) synthesis enzyme MnmG [Calditrichaceae bacterium]
MKQFDVAVIGGGHAGIEAAIVSARLGLKTALITLDKNKIGLMSCNPAIGGLAKGQLVREIDALGGVMGKITDESGIHFKMLNTSKGPAVQSPRAQADRIYYAKVAQKYIENTENLTVIQDMATGINVRGDKVDSVTLKKNGILPVHAAVLTAGTFLNGIIHIGLNQLAAGRSGELPAVGITESLKLLGFESGRLKTGTPPRIHRDSIDYSKIEVQLPDEFPQPFSFSTEGISRKQINCHITYTNPSTHDELRRGFDFSPMFGGRIQGVGPRYCPSIEDKINRFADRERHQLFLEPEGYENDEVYLNGFSTSLPADVQEKAIRTIRGLENAKIIRLGYAVEYDFFSPNQLQFTLETKMIGSLYFAGQINGTSGYEEAAAQGFVAGINAALKLKGLEPFVLKRSDAYVGVLVDDLINKIHEEPYRMFTSRAEFRLMLRHDNADLRLMEKGRAFGLIDDGTYERYQKRQTQIEYLRDKELNKKIMPETFNLSFKNISSSISQGIAVKDIVKRPEITLSEILNLVSEKNYDQSSIKEVEFGVKYDGYIDRQNMLMEKFKKIEDKKIAEDINYDLIKSLSTEAREKLNKIRPVSLGQASRISGVSPADLSVLVIYIEKFSMSGVSRET